MDTTVHQRTESSVALTQSHSSTKTSGRAPTIRIAESTCEKDALYEFRYRIYVEEMQRTQKHADHSRKRITDPLDESGVSLIAVDWEGAIVGTVRTNFASAGDLMGYESFYAMTTAGAAHPVSTSICTRLMISAAHRRSMLALRLSLAVYEYGLFRGITHNFIDCNSHLVGLFEGLGFRKHIPAAFHEEYGAVTCMRLDVRDLAYLQSIGSPFVATLLRWKDGADLASTAVNPVGGSI